MFDLGRPVADEIGGAGPACNLYHGLKKMEIGQLRSFSV